MRVLCYGDSNTWGYISGSDHQRYNENERWTRLLKKQLGSNYEIIEEGLNSRTLLSEDNRPSKEGRNGFTYLKPCLDTHDKIDLFILMLGTNEFKAMFENSPHQILEMFIKYVEYLKNYKSQIDKKRFKIIISGVPLVKESQGEQKYKGAEEKSKDYSKLVKHYCYENNLTYIDNTDLDVGIDGVHLTKESHQKLAKKLYNVIKNPTM